MATEPVHGAQCGLLGWGAMGGAGGLAITPGGS